MTKLFLNLVKYFEILCIKILDVTPNGSLRRRKSRVPSEEDDHNLIHYLTTSGHDESRERKSFSATNKNNIMSGKLLS